MKEDLVRRVNRFINILLLLVFSLGVWAQNDSVPVTDVPEIDSILEQAQKERQEASHAVSQLCKQQIKLITAIDRHIALDTFAETEGLGLDEVLDELELLAEQKRRLDISYFTDEVLGDDCMNELLDYFENAKTDDMEMAMKEYGDIYKEEELRLARIVFRMNKIS